MRWRQTVQGSEEEAHLRPNPWQAEKCTGRISHNSVCRVESFQHLETGQQLPTSSSLCLLRVWVGHLVPIPPPTGFFPFSPMTVSTTIQPPSVVALMESLHPATQGKYILLKRNQTDYSFFVVVVVLVSTNKVTVSNSSAVRTQYVFIPWELSRCRELYKYTHHKDWFSFGSPDTSCEVEIFNPLYSNHCKQFVQGNTTHQCQSQHLHLTEVISQNMLVLTRGFGVKHKLANSFFKFVCCQSPTFKQVPLQENVVNWICS